MKGGVFFALLLVRVPGFFSFLKIRRSTLANGPDPLKTMTKKGLGACGNHSYHGTVIVIPLRKTNKQTVCDHLSFFLFPIKERSFIYPSTTNRRPIMHDLQFEVQNGDGRPQERPIAGELSHFPDHFSQARAAGSVSNNGATTQTTGGLEFISTQLKQSSHPNVIIFHLLFKGAALFLYFFGNWFGKSGSRFITLTVICILFLAADFWVVKNVTGRLLVGLRWWNKVEEDDTLWIFESAEDKVVNKFDRTVFWTVLYATPVVWAAFFLLGVLKWSIQWLLIDILALSMSLANVYGYYRCSKEQASQFQDFMQAGARQGAAAMIRSNMLTMLTGTNTNARSTGSNGFGP